jgi:hypothetical protein
VDQTQKVSRLIETYKTLESQIEAGQAAQEKLNQVNPDVQNGTTKGRLNPLDNTPDKNSIQSKQQLRDIEKELQQADDNTSKNMQSNAQQSTTAFEDVTNAVDILNQSIVNTESPTEQLTGLISQVGQVGLNSGEAAASGIAIIGQEAEAQVGGVYALVDALAALAEAQAAAGGGGGGFASRGRYFAGGGQARGTDTIPAMLTKGEIVMNAGASRQFFSQLMAMNAGVQPAFLSKGGQAGGNTFGDINVNVSNNGPGNIDARAIAQGIQREMRRNTIRSF